MVIATPLFLGLMLIGSEDPKGQPPGTGDQEALLAEMKQIDREVAEYHRVGKAIEAVERLERRVVVTRALYPATQFPEGHVEIGSSLHNLAVFRQRAGQTAQAFAAAEEALAMRRAIAAKAGFPIGFPQVANSLGLVAALCRSLAKFEQAIKVTEEAYAIRQRLYPVEKFPKGHSELAQSLSDLAITHHTFGQFDTAREYYERALTMARQLFPKQGFPRGQFEVAHALRNLSAIESLLGRVERAVVSSRESLELLQELFAPSRFPQGHIELARSHAMMGTVLRRAGDLNGAKKDQETALAMVERLLPTTRYPHGHPLLMEMLNDLGMINRELGLFDSARGLFERALAMHEKLFPRDQFPKGTDEQAQILNNLGLNFNETGNFAAGLAAVERAHEILRALYPPERFPNGSLNVATSLANVSAFHLRVGNFDQAVTAAEQSLAEFQRLYPESRFPDGHAALVLPMNSLSIALAHAGQADRAGKLLEEAAAMTRRLYPESRYSRGHPDLVRSLNNLAGYYIARGEAAKAASLAIESARWAQQIAEERLWLASESEAYSMLQSQAVNRDTQLSYTLASTDSTPAVYANIWRSRSSVLQVLELRRKFNRTADADQRRLMDQLRDNRRRTEKLMQQSPARVEERDRQFQAVNEERDRLERELAARMPTYGQWSQRGRDTPDRLAAQLPEDSVYLDLLRYLRVAPRHDGSGKIVSSYSSHYVAFVVAPHQPVVRVELGPCEPIDTAISTWRRAILAKTSSPAAETIAQRVWRPIAKHLPPRVATIHLTPDGDLARIPWPAIPDEQPGSILLERFAISIVPHGQFLIDAQPSSLAARPDAAALVVGDVAYNSPEWAPLPGSKRELSSIHAVAPNVPAMTGPTATAPAVREQLPRVGWAHFATHGYFDERQLSDDWNRVATALKRWRIGDEIPRFTAAKNPMGYVGLVLSGGEVMTGLSLLDLNLENLKLVTLSACETGLGGLTGGEGVQGLQRAFHLSGVANVVASLWQVSDAATAALMAKFYHELLINKRPPLVALREAQLTLYYHPELIPDLAGERGAPKFRDAVAVTASTPTVAQGSHAATHHWAAFLLSGAGK